MPGLAFEPLPAGVAGSYQMEGGERVDIPRRAPTEEELLGKGYRTAFDALQRKYKIELEGIQTQLLTDTQFVNQRSKLNAKYKDKIDDLDTARSAKQEEINKIRQSTQPGPERGVQMREIYEKGAAKQGPFSRAEVEGMAKLIDNQMAQAEEEPRLRRGDFKTRESLIAEYLALRNVLRITDPERQKTFDDIWNMRVLGNKKKYGRWFDKQGNPPAEMRIAGAQGPGARAMKRKALGTPIGRSIIGYRRSSQAGYGGYPTPVRGPQVTRPQETRPQATTPQSTQRIRVKSPDGREGTIPFSEWADKQREGFTRIQ